MSEKYIIPTPGDVVAGKYHIERELGRGAYGVVFRAKQDGIGRHVALKTLLPKAFLETDIVERFEREAQFVGRLNHPNVVRVHDYGRHENLLYMAVEYVEGPTLEDIIADEAPLEPDRVRRLVYQMIDALEHAHERSIVHRDLKPANIILLQQPGAEGEPEVVKVLDFGIAKLIHTETEEENHNTLTQAGTVLGTPHYMSPETIIGDAVDHRADVYSLGVIIYEMLTGERPFGAKNSPGVMVKHLRDKPPALPEHLEHSCWGEAVRRCMEKRPEKRLPSAGEVRDILERRDEGQRTGAPGASTTAQRAITEPKSRLRGLLGAVAAGSIFALAIAAAFYFMTPGEPDTDKPDKGEPTVATAEEQADEPAEEAQPTAKVAEQAVAEQPTLDFDADEVEPGGADDEDPLADEPAVAIADEPADSAAGGSDSKEAGKPEESGERTPARKRSKAASTDKSRARKSEASGSAERSDDGGRKPEAKSTKVRLVVEATPKNSRVVLDGTPLGNAPVNHHLDESDEPLTLEVSHIGYRTKYETIVPNRDRTVRVALEKGRLKLVP